MKKIITISMLFLIAMAVRPDTLAEKIEYLMHVNNGSAVLSS